MVGSLAFRPLGLAVWGPIALGAGVGTSLCIAFVLQTATALTLMAIPRCGRSARGRQLRSDWRLESRGGGGGRLWICHPGVWKIRHST